MLHELMQFNLMCDLLQWFLWIDFKVTVGEALGGIL